MSDDRLIALGDVAEHVTVGHVGPTSQYYCDDGIPFLRTQNVGSGEVLLNDVKHITPEFHARLKKSTLKAGDLLISRVISSEIRTAVVPAHLDGANCANIIVVRPGNRVHSPYLLHLISSPLIQRRLLQRKVGSAQSVVNTGVVKSWELPLPPILEQRRIADILDKADAIRRKRQETIALTESLLRSAFLEMFGDPVTNPKGWPVAPIGDVSEIQGGLQVTAKRKNHPIAMPYLRVANVYPDRLDLAEIKEIRVHENEIERVCLKRGDILMVEGHGNRDEIWRSAVWDASIGRCLHQNHLIRVRVDPKRAIPEYVSAYLNSAGGRRQLFRFGKTTSGLNTISTGNVRATQLLLPPLENQARYGAMLTRNANLKARMGESLHYFSELFDSLVQRAFRGEL